MNILEIGSKVDADSLGLPGAGERAFGADSQAFPCCGPWDHIWNGEGLRYSRGSKKKRCKWPEQTQTTATEDAMEDEGFITPGSLSS